MELLFYPWGSQLSAGALPGRAQRRRPPAAKSIAPAPTTAPAQTAPATGPAAMPPFVEFKQPGFKSEMELRSYCMGVQLAQGYKREDLNLDMDALIKGMKDVMTGQKIPLSKKEIQFVMTVFMNEMRVKVTKARLTAAQDNKKAGQAFLAANRDKSGVVSLPSGLQYKILQAGTGRKPAADGVVDVLYPATLIDGTQVDSTDVAGEPATLAVSDPHLIAGFREALKLMPLGSKWELYIPHTLAYGPQGHGYLIGPNATLIYEVSLLAIK